MNPSAAIKPISPPEEFTSNARKLSSGNSGSPVRCGPDRSQVSDKGVGGAPLPANESARLDALRRYAILDTPPEPAFDRITRLVAATFKVPIALVSLIDAKRQWFKSCVGLDVCQTPRAPAFCAYAILADDVMVVPDARLDARFRENPFVTGAPHIRFYAGAPLRTADGFNLGTLCIIDSVPRDLGPAQVGMLADFAAIVTDELELRLAVGKLSAEIAERQRMEETLRLLSGAVEQSRESILITDAQLDLPGPRILFANPAFTKLTGYLAEELVGKTPRILQGPETDRDVLSRLRGNLARGEDFVGEALNYRKDGTPFHLEWQIAPIRNAQKVVTHFVSIQRDITERKRAEAERAAMNQRMLEVSHQAGMAEVATSVLHNVGNVLNSVNISATLAAEGLRKSKSGDLTRVVALLDEHAADLTSFIGGDQGRRLPEYLRHLSEQLTRERATTVAELQSLCENVDHIKDIVAMQQNYAKVSGVTDVFQVSDLVEYSLRMNAVSLTRHKIELVREYGEVPSITVEKNKVLQILVNLIGNAKNACDDTGRKDKQITIRVGTGPGSVRVAVIDNGVGISGDNLARIFNHGFTTRKNGHGFGLHNSVLTAREMGGDLTVQSNGYGTGATFTLELPLATGGRVRESVLAWRCP